MHKVEKMGVRAHKHLSKKKLLESSKLYAVKKTLEGGVSHPGNVMLHCFIKAMMKIAVL